jgi:hypothetical protein
MQDQGERNFHRLMGGLLLVSLVIDQQEFETWRAGQVSMISLVLAMAWIGRSALEGFRRRDARVKILENRLAAVEERVDELEREARARRAPL